MPFAASRLFVRCLVCLLAVAALSTAPARAQDDEETDEDSLPTIAEKTEDLERTDGFVPFYWDARQGKLWLEIDRFDEDLL